VVPGDGTPEIINLGSALSQTLTRQFTFDTAGDFVLTSYAVAAGGEAYYNYELVGFEPVYDWVIVRSYSCGSIFNSRTCYDREWRQVDSRPVYANVLRSRDWSSAGFANPLAITVTAVSEPNPIAVPEPASLGLFGLGLVGLIAARRRKAAIV
jgi:hypothetical protein